QSEVMDDFVLRNNRERTAIREIPPGIQRHELWIACEGIVSGETNTIWCGNIHRHEPNGMIGNKTKCSLSQRVTNNIVVDDGFPELQFPNTNDFFRQHRNPLLIHKSRALNVSPWRISPVSSPRLNQRTLCSDEPCVNESGTT